MTDERHSIWLDAPSWFCRPNSTDWQMKLSFVREFSDLQASIVDSWFFNLVYSALYVSIHFLSGRVYEWFTHVCACLRAWVLKRRGAEIVISQGLEPPLPKGAKVIWETFFLDQTPGESDPEFRRGGSNMWIRAVERFGGRVDRCSRYGERESAEENVSGVCREGSRPQLCSSRVRASHR